MLPILKLIRLPNLLVVVLTQLLVFYHLIVPALERHDIVVQLTHWEFWLISLACVLVTAAGYVINDILDADGDAVNRPGKNQVYGIGIDRCRYLYLGFVLSGYGIALALTFSTGKQSLLWIYPLITGVLALYSRYLKTIPFLGNILVAVLCAGVPAIIALAEQDGLVKLWPQEPLTIRLLLIYGCFAFLSTWLRELVKDLEDIRGDRLLGRRTVPLLLGVRFSLALALGLVALNVLAILSPYYLDWSGFEQRTVMILLGLLTVGLITTAYLLVGAKTGRDYGRISSGIKLIMLLGLLMLATL